MQSTNANFFESSSGEKTVPKTTESKKQGRETLVSSDEQP